MKTHALLILISLSLLTPSLFSYASTAPISEEARKHFLAGTALAQHAKTAADLSRVVNEFKRAADLAPQLPEARYNLARAREAAGDYSGAIADLKRYQQFKLSDSESRMVQDKIYALEAKAKKQTGEQEVAANEQRKNRDKLGFLAGKWSVLATSVCSCPYNGDARHDEATVTIAGRSISITRQRSYNRVIKGTIQGDDF